MSRWLRAFQTALTSLSSWLLSQLLGLVIVIVIFVLLMKASTTRSEGIYHLIMFGVVGFPAGLLLFFGLKGGRKNISIWRVGFVLSGLILAPLYVIVSLDRLGFL